MFFGYTIRFLFEGFLELTFAVIIQLYNVAVEEPGFPVYYSLLWTGLMIAGLVLVALYVPYVNFLNYRTLDNPVFKRRYGDLIVGLKIDIHKDPDDDKVLKARTVAILCACFFLVRRILFVICAVWLA